MIYLQWKSSLVWLRGETAIQDIWLVWFHIIMPFRTKNGTDALFTKKFCQMVIYIQYSMLSLTLSLSTQSNIHLNYDISGIIFIADESSKDAEYKLAQSGDATCNGLDSAEVLLLFSSQII